MKNVLIIANIRKTQGGITTQVKELSDSLISENVNVSIASTHGSVVERIRGIKSAFYKAKECDVILGVGCAYTGFFPIVIAFIISLLRDKYVVYNFHDGQIKEFMKRYYGIINYVIKNNKVIVATKYLDNEFKNYGFNSEIIANHFNDLIVNQSEIVNYGKIKIMWARSFEKLYRADIALEAAVYFSKDMDIEFHFYGGGKEYDYYKDKYCGKNIIFHGILNRDELLKEYKKYQIFLNTTEFDNFPMSLVEAGLNKLIVISSKVGGIDNLYTDEEIVFFESGNTESLISVLEKVLKNISEYSALSKNLMNKVSSYNWLNVRRLWLNSLNINKA